MAYFEYDEWGARFCKCINTVFTGFDQNIMHGSDNSDCVSCGVVFHVAQSRFTLLVSRIKKHLSNWMVVLLSFIFKEYLRCAVLNTRGFQSYGLSSVDGSREQLKNIPEPMC